MNTVEEIVAVLGELSLLRQDPDALARREEILLATKAALVERIRAEDAPVAVVVPSGDDDATMCPVCRCTFAATGKRRYCSDRCRRAAWVRRHHSPPAVAVVPAPVGSRRPHTVYECDACGLRALGEQRCEDCGTFMRRVGLGGPCPSCDDPVAAAELIDVVEVTGRRR
ncbi:MAG: hypothetical protein ACRDZW_04645 [Acidimicrobiales bacterium]